MTKLQIDAAVVQQALDAAREFINDVHFGEWAGPGYRRNNVQDLITDALAALQQPEQQAEPCPKSRADDLACKNRHQCWEPCGELGKSEAHAKAVPQRTKEKTSEMAPVFETARKAVAHRFSHYHTVMRGQQALAGEPEVVAAITIDVVDDIRMGATWSLVKYDLPAGKHDLIILQYHREAMAAEAQCMVKMCASYEDAIAKKDEAEQALRQALKACEVNARRWRFAFIESPDWTYAVCKWDKSDKEWYPLNQSDGVEELDAAITRGQEALK